MNTDDTITVSFQKQQARAEAAGGLAGHIESMLKSGDIPEKDRARVRELVLAVQDAYGSRTS